MFRYLTVVGEFKSRSSGCDAM